MTLPRETSLTTHTTTAVSEAGVTGWCFLRVRVGVESFAGIVAITWFNTNRGRNLSIINMILMSLYLVSVNMLLMASNGHFVHDIPDLII